MFFFLGGGVVFNQADIVLKTKAKCNCAHIVVMVISRTGKGKEGKNAGENGGLGAKLLKRPPPPPTPLFHLGGRLE